MFGMIAPSGKQITIVAKDQQAVDSGHTRLAAVSFSTDMAPMR
jgi:hypothetical protein